MAIVYLFLVEKDLKKDHFQYKKKEMDARDEQWREGEGE